MQAPQTARFRFSHSGVISKETPDLLKDGQYRSMSNMEVLQEGGLASRSGRRILGTTSVATDNAILSCYEIRKMVLQEGENPGSPSLNPRYLGVADKPGFSLLRTYDYKTSFKRVAPGINTPLGSTRKGFSLSPYAPGNVGSSWGFIASEMAMLKDSGAKPYATPIGDARVTSATAANPCVLTLISASGLAVGARVTVWITGATGKWAAINQRWDATVTGTFTLSIPINSTGFGALPADIICWFQALPRWGVLPAAGVAMVAANSAGATASAAVSAIDFTNIDGAIDTWDGIILTLATDEPLHDLTTITLSGIAGITISSSDGRTDINDSWDIRAGVPDQFGTVGYTANKFRIFDRNGQAVTGTGAYGGGGTAGNIAVGGLDTSSSEAQAYDYRYTYVASDTHSEGNPSQEMLADSAITQAGFSGDGLAYSSAPFNGTNANAKVLVWGTDDPQIGWINIYRRGGILFDAWRLVGQADNPGAGKQASFLDQRSDDDLKFSPILSVDNDPPVPSRPPAPITGSFAAIAAAGRQTVKVTLGGLAGVTPGSLLHLFYDNPEDVIVENITSLTGAIAGATNADPTVLQSVGHGLTGNPTVAIAGASGAWQAINGTWTVIVIDADHFSVPVDATLFGALAGFPAFKAVVSLTATFQHTHSADADFEVDTICGQPCHLAISFSQFQILAGDPNNPHMLYRSTGDTPESFTPTPADGSISTMAAGNPTNPIIDLTEFRGQILTLNRFALYETLIMQGSLLQPSQVAYKGVVGRRAWCKRPSEIWLLATDGVYSWDGGNFTKRSEQIDNIFHGGTNISGATLGQTVNKYKPLDESKWDACILEAKGGEIHLVYVDTDGHTQRLICEPNFGDRWKPYAAINPAVTYLYTEADTGSMIESRPAGFNTSFALYDQSVVSGGRNYTTDDFDTDPTTQGSPIPFSISLPWFDFGSPSSEKLLQEAMLELDTSGSGTGASLSVDLLENYDEDNPVETLAIPLDGSNRKLVSLVAGMQNPDAAKGQQARAFSYRFYGAACPTRIQFFNLAIRFQDVGEQTAGTGTDWDNLGSKFDKKLYQFTVEFDTQGTDQMIVLDTITGRDSNVYTPAVQKFRLTNPTLVGGPGSTRAMKTFPVLDSIIAKEIRLRAVPDAAAGQASPKFFRIAITDFIKEEFPPDVMAFTPRTDGGTSYLKYANQVTLEVDTGGVEVEVWVQADGANKFSFPVNTTESSRECNITLPPNLTGYWWRLYCDPSQSAIYGKSTDQAPTGTGKFQLFHHNFRFQPADKGEVAHTQDWQDHGWPHDKRLNECVIEWDNSGGADVQLTMDLLTGIDGGTVLANVARFDLLANQGRSQKSFPLPDGLIAKKTRVYPATAPLPLGFKSWSYSCEFEKFPPDVILFTEPKDFGYPYRKIARNLILKIDTGGVDCTIDLLADGLVVDSFTVNTTLDDWRRFLAVKTGLAGRLWKLRLTPGRQGKAQLFDWDLDCLKLPAEISLWSSYEQALGFAGWKFIKTGWVMYQCASPFCLTVISETGSHTWTLPPHVSRTPEFFYLPPVLGSGLNKSRVYDVIAKSEDGRPFSLYPDASWLEWIACGADRHAGYQKTLLSEMMQIPV